MGTEGVLLVSSDQWLGADNETVSLIIIVFPHWFPAQELVVTGPLLPALCGTRHASLSSDTTRVSHLVTLCCGGGVAGTSDQKTVCRSVTQTR